MSAQALATALGPPLMLHSSGNTTDEVDHAQPIAVLKYLLQIWPQPQSSANASGNVKMLISRLLQTKIGNNIFSKKIFNLTPTKKFILIILINVTFDSFNIDN
jgi:hypothetical protein